MSTRPPFPGIRVTTNGNQLVSYHTEARITQGGIFYPITPSTEMGEMYQQAFAEGKLDVFGRSKIAVECEGEHAAQGGAIAYSVTGTRTVNFTSGQGIVYGVEQYYHAPGKLSTMVLEVAARALTRHALNVHCGHDDVYACLDTGWIILFGKDAQQAADQAVILRKVCEKALTPGINVQDGFLTSHLERTFYKHEAELLRRFLGDVDDVVACPTEAQRVLFGPTRRRVPRMIDLRNPTMLGPVQNQEHYMNGVVARRDCFAEPILGFLEEAWDEWARLTGRRYGPLTRYACDDADTVFVSLGSAAENIEAAVDWLRAERGARVGSIHVDVLRPFPEAAVVEAVRGKRNLIVLERTDEALAGDNPLGRDLRTALSRARDHAAGLPALDAAEIPRIFSGVYGLGSRDFRPEHVIGAWEYATEQRTRRDGRGATDGQRYFTLGIDHPYAVEADARPSLLPEGSIAVRLHSIGGWGMITTGKNLAEVLGKFGEWVSERDGLRDEHGRPLERIHVSANPKYGSEKKGAPTAYFLVAGPERIRVNCDLRHVDVVLCCDPKAFTHIDPLDGLVDGGAFVWESDEAPEGAWERVPPRFRAELVRRRIRVFLLPGFDIARRATDREDLQLRMQGNAFLGAFFRVSPFLEEFGIDEERFREVVRAQYEKKFGRFGEAVVESNMEVMLQGFGRLVEMPYGPMDAEDLSSMRGDPLLPTCGTGGCASHGTPAAQAPRAPLFRRETFDREFRAGLGYHQPASPLASVGLMAAATGDTASKYGARRETPVFIQENCTQCMACITACPDTALPNTAQELGTVLETAVRHYVEDEGQRGFLLAALPAIEPRVRAEMRAHVKDDAPPAVQALFEAELARMPEVTGATVATLHRVLGTLPLAYAGVNAIFASRERREAGSGGLFSIFVSDLCKGCGECVTECGDHEALVMRPDGEAVNEVIVTANAFRALLPQTPAGFLGKFDPEHPEESKAATLRNHLMMQKDYDALVSGDGACAGCGEKSALRGVASVTEAYMRPIFHRKAARLRAKADRLEREGEAVLARWRERDPAGHRVLLRTVASVLMGLGGEDDADTEARLAALPPVDEARAVEALVLVLRREAFEHGELQAIDGRLPDGMSVMAMGAHTGCNTVYGSTPPNNPHPYPWMNSLFQDGVTISWLMGESFVLDTARRSIVPERLADHVLDDRPPGERDRFDYTHFSDTLMTDREVHELPKVWAIGGDGGMGDIGYQNLSKVVVQNRPNVKALMLNTQVYSNTGGQNSDASPMTGGFDMNQIGAATQGKLVEMKNPAESFLAGHGSPFVAQVSLADAARFYKAILDALEYRGTAFFNVFTTCQPEHGVADSMATVQARRIRDSRGLPDFVLDPRRGEDYRECLALDGNRQADRDWTSFKPKGHDRSHAYTTAHWCATEARFRNHFRKVTAEACADLVPLEELLQRITQRDVVDRRFLVPDHRAFVPDFGAWILVEDAPGRVRHLALSRQMVLFCVERRKSWRLLQSKAGIVNKDYAAQKERLASEVN
ncbi:MAG: 2-oxoacid:acceptor oxidoreductase family protein [Planctomycetota bacterium]